ncbi:MAG: hypothetical protein JSS95_12970 [Acidobacteria bacterium]|nr:hypothetical protein [Acidobacteriota bacterium]
MTFTKTQIGSALAIGVATVAIVGGISTISRFEDIDVLLAPGLLFAAVFFQQGIHSDHANLYLIVAVVFDVMFFGLLALLIIRIRSKNGLRIR